LLSSALDIRDGILKRNKKGKNWIASFSGNGINPNEDMEVKIMPFVEVVFDYGSAILDRKSVQEIFSRILRDMGLRVLTRFDQYLE
jgi:hypothetical protein